MLIPELKAFSASLIQLPIVAKVHAAGLDLLRAAFTEADFKIVRPLSTELVAPGAAPAYWAGFEVADPGTGANLRVMGCLGYSTLKTKDGVIKAGWAHGWTAHRTGVSSALDLSAAQRLLCRDMVAANRFSMAELVNLDEGAVRKHFEEALAASKLSAMRWHAKTYVAGVADALAP